MLGVVNRVQKEPDELTIVHLNMRILEYLLQTLQFAPVEVLQDKLAGIPIDQPVLPVRQPNNPVERIPTLLFLEHGFAAPNIFLDELLRMHSSFLY